MGLVKMRISVIQRAMGFDTKLLAMTLLSLPEKTKLVGIEKEEYAQYLIFEHPDFIDGSEITGNYIRSCYIVNKDTDKAEVRTIDQFIGLDLKEALGDR